MNSTMAFHLVEETVDVALTLSICILLLSLLVVSSSPFIPLNSGQLLLLLLHESFPVCGDVIYFHVLLLFMVGVILVIHKSSALTSLMETSVSFTMA